MTHPQARPALASAAVSILSTLLLSPAVFGQQGDAGNGNRLDPDKARVIAHWTQERRENAIPRDLVIDTRGLGYLRRADGRLRPYGHEISPADGAETPSPLARPAGGSDDTTAPIIEQLSPAENGTIGASATFSARVTDDQSGVRSVSVVITYPDGVTTQTFSAADVGGDIWSVTLQGFTDGTWSWTVIARDNAKRGGNQSTSKSLSFFVDTGAGSGGSSGGGSASDTVSNAIWTGGGAVQMAAGRLYFEMPSNSKRKGPWTAYVCSGTVVDDNASDGSVVLTAAHCVYDDVNKAFARNVLFIPDQAETTAGRTDTDCSNDPLGCWVASYGVVDSDWTTRTFPSNIEWDYAYYVISDMNAHADGLNFAVDALDLAAGALQIDFSAPIADDDASRNDYTHALGYSYSEDPNFMYCAEDMTTEGAVNWWLPSCLLSGGSSGGPWLQPLDENSGSGSIISVNSWGYTTSSGMAGPMLDTECANFLFMFATSNPSVATSTDGDAGAAVTCSSSP